MPLGQLVLASTDGHPSGDNYPDHSAGHFAQVSDLDGTMVGDGPEADAGTAAFCAYWEDAPALTGGVLVYNTGRSLGQFTGLWASKGGALALPDVLITAVGTKARRAPGVFGGFQGQGCAASVKSGCAGVQHRALARAVHRPVGVPGRRARAAGRAHHRRRHQGAARS